MMSFLSSLRSRLKSALTIYLCLATVGALFGAAGSLVIAFSPKAGPFVAWTIVFVAAICSVYAVEPEAFGRFSIWLSRVWSGGEAVAIPSRQVRVSERLSSIETQLEAQAQLLTKLNVETVGSCRQLSAEF